MSKYWFFHTIVKINVCKYLIGLPLNGLDPKGKSTGSSMFLAELLLLFCCIIHRLGAVEITKNRRTRESPVSVAARLDCRARGFLSGLA